MPMYEHKKYENKAAEIELKFIFILFFFENLPKKKNNTQRRQFAGHTYKIMSEARPYLGEG